MSIRMTVDASGAINRFRRAVAGWTGAKHTILEKWARESERIIREEGEARFKHSTGRLGRSVKSIIRSDQVVTGPTAYYAGWVESGRGPVRPIGAKCLHFFIGGAEVFTMYSRPFPGHFFIKAARERIRLLAPQIAGKIVKLKVCD